MSAYYNEFDPYAAEWLRNLVKAGHIAPGDVDERSIEDVHPDDLRGYTQCHFFAGVGVWSYSLRLAGWPDDNPIWTGSCPCQPFSSAGKGEGFADERHRWPDFFHLIRECAPAIILGEQVASPDGLAWLDLVQTDLEREGYTCGTVDTCSAGVGAPHIRQRLRFAAQRLADTGRSRPQGRSERRNGTDKQPVGAGSVAGGLADNSSVRREVALQHSGSIGQATGERQADVAGGDGAPDRAGPVNGFWGDADWIHCRDGKWRPVEPGTFPLAHGVTQRVGRLCAYGNAVDAQATKVFIESYMDYIDAQHLV